jgi:hypothetical protein
LDGIVVKLCEAAFYDFERFIACNPQPPYAARDYACIFQFAVCLNGTAVDENGMNPGTLKKNKVIKNDAGGVFVF